MTNILALDPANHTGWAHSNGAYGVWNLSSPLDSHKGQRLERLEQHLEAAIAEMGCDTLAAEDASFGSPNPAVQAMHNELRGVIHLVGFRHSIPVRLFAPSTIKAFACGSGRAKKPQMIAALKRLLGITTVDDNVADAIWIRELCKRPDCWAKAPAKKVKLPKGTKAARLFR